jgi:hypothetical protein
MISQMVAGACGAGHQRSSRADLVQAQHNVLTETEAACDSDGPSSVQH